MIIKTTHQEIPKKDLFYLLVKSLKDLDQQNCILENLKTKFQRLFLKIEGILAENEIISEIKFEEIFREYIN